MKTLADFKRSLRVGDMWECTHMLSGTIAQPITRHKHSKHILQGNRMNISRSQLMDYIRKSELDNITYDDKIEIALFLFQSINQRAAELIEEAIFKLENEE